MTEQIDLKATIDKIFDGCQIVTDRHYALISIGKAMCRLGMPAGEDLLCIAEDLRDAAQMIRYGAGESVHERVVASEQATNNMMRAVFAGIKVAGERA